MLVFPQLPRLRALRQAIGDPTLLVIPAAQRRLDAIRRFAHEPCMADRTTVHRLHPPATLDSPRARGRRPPPWRQLMARRQRGNLVAIVRRRTVHAGDFGQYWRDNNQWARERSESARAPNGTRALIAWLCKWRTRCCDAGMPMMAGCVGLARSLSAPVALPSVDTSPVTSSKSSWIWNAKPTAAAYRASAAYSSGSRGGAHSAAISTLARITAPVLRACMSSTCPISSRVP